MKDLKYYLFFILVFCLSIHSKAQHSGNINKFEILPEYLVNGRVKISDGPETIIKYKVTFAREMATTVPKITWKPFNMRIRLSAGDKNNNIVLFDSPYTITSADFGENDAFIKDKVFSGTIVNSKLYQGNPIILAFTTDGKDFPIGAFEGKMYNFDLPTVVNPPIVTPPVKADSIPVWHKRINIGGGDMLSTNPAQAVPYDGIETRDKMFYAYDKPVSGTVPIYQLYIDHKDGYPRYDYKYSQDPDFYDNDGTTHVHQIDSKGNIVIDWTNKKIAFYAFAKQVPGTIPIYGSVNTNGKNYFYSESELYTGRPSLGVIFYAYPTINEGRDGRGGRPAEPGDRSGEPERPTREPGGPERPPRGSGSEGGGRSGRG